jgi:hypothetical protein
MSYSRNTCIGKTIHLQEHLLQPIMAKTGREATIRALEPQGIFLGQVEKASCK